MNDHELGAVGCDSVRVGHDGEPQIQIPWVESEESQFTFHAGFQNDGVRVESYCWMPTTASLRRSGEVAGARHQHVLAASEYPPLLK